MVDVETFFCPTCEKPFEFPRGQRDPYQFFRCRPCTEKMPELAQQVKRLTVHVQGGVAKLESDIDINYRIVDWDLVNDGDVDYPDFDPEDPNDVAEYDLVVEIEGGIATIAHMSALVDKIGVDIIDHD